MSLQSSNEGPFSTKNIVLSGVLLAVALVLSLTGLGYFPVPNIAQQATIMHVPAIIGAVLGGPIVGLIVNLVFSFDSYTRFIGGFTWPNAIAPILTLFVSRLAIGVVAWLVYRALKNVNEIVALAAAGAAGALANTAFVLGFAIAFGVLTVDVIPAVTPQIIFEAVLGAIVTVAVVAAYKRLAVGRGGSSV